MKSHIGFSFSNILLIWLVLWNQQLFATMTILLSSIAESLLSLAIKVLKKYAYLFWSKVELVPTNPSTHSGVWATMKLILKLDGLSIILPCCPFLAQPFVLIVSRFIINSSRSTTWNFSLMKYDTNLIQNKRLDLFSGLSLMGLFYAQLFIVKFKVFSE